MQIRKTWSIKPGALGALSNYLELNMNNITKSMNRDGQDFATMNAHTTKDEMQS